MWAPKGSGTPTEHCGHHTGFNRAHHEMQVASESAPCEPLLLDLRILQIARARFVNRSRVSASMLEHMPKSRRGDPN